MQDQESERTSGSARGSGTLSGSIASAASDVYAKTSELTGEAAERARQAAGEAASTATTQIKELLDRQVGVGASMIGDVAHSVHRAADDLDHNAPLLAGVARGLADRMSGYSGSLEGQSVDDLLRAASDMTRRQPALVFGLAALAGFFVFRTFKNAPGAPSTITAPPIQPAQHGFGEQTPGYGSQTGPRPAAMRSSNGL